MDFLEFPDITLEMKGAMTPGRLKLTDQQIIFKNSKTGKVDQFSSSDIDVINWQRLAGGWGFRVFLKSGALYRFGGFRESDEEKLSKFFVSNYKKDLSPKELCIKGWNWGTAKFSGNVLNFEVSNTTSFEVPLQHVSQCTPGKNEVTLEFHQNDNVPVGLMEMRFYIPTSDLAGEDLVENFQQQVMKKASVTSASGDALAIFREMQCLTPRGRYDMKVYQTFFQLHGKTYDYKIPMSTVLKLFLLPHKDNRQCFFVVSLDPPIKQGQTRYHYLVLLFGQEEETQVELPLSEEELKEKFDGRLEKELNGPTVEVISKIMKALVNRKIVVPGGFVGASGTPAVGSTYKANAGYLYPLERGFIYVHKPPLHIRFEEISNVNFERSGANTRSFDFVIETKSGIVHTFSSIEKEEYGKLYDFIVNKKLRVKNRGKDNKSSYNADEFVDSDAEDGAPDAYLARVKAEAKERADDELGDGDDESDEDESEDEDFNPNAEESDVAEEYDSAAKSDSDDSGDDDGGGGGGSGSDAGKKSPKKKKSKPEKRPSKEPKKSSGKPRKEKKERDENKPKRPQTAFMLWMNENRERLKKEHPKLSMIELAKKSGEIWREMKDKKEWEDKVAVQKKKYDEEMKEYIASGGGKTAKASSSGSKPSSQSKSKSKSSSSPVKQATGSGFKSKEYIESSGGDESSSEESDSDEKPLKKKSPAEGGGGDGKKQKKEKQQTVAVKKEKGANASSDEERGKGKGKGKGEQKGTMKRRKSSGSDEEDEDEEDGEGERSEDDKKKSAAKKKKKEPSSPPKSSKKPVKKEKDESDNEEELEDEEEILSTPTASGEEDDSGEGDDSD